MDPGSRTPTSSVGSNPTLRVVSAERWENDRLVVNQVTVKRPKCTRRFDVVRYRNAPPVAVVELKTVTRER